ncbi:MAG: argininosuccinate synthase [Novosphingobium sp.]
MLEDPWEETPDYVYSRTDHPEIAPDVPEYITIDFRTRRWRCAEWRGDEPAALLTALNDLGRKHGIGRELDLVENRFVGMKSRGMYRNWAARSMPARTRGIRSITLDRGAAHLKDELMPKYAELIYNGFWISHPSARCSGRRSISARQGFGHGAAQALQGQCQRGRAQITQLALFRAPCDL